MEHSELWKKYRPQSFKDVVGQTHAIKLLEGYLRNNNVPHALLFTGASGCGKSTLAHILAREMGCTTLNIDLNVINCAAIDKPIETIRSLKDQVKLSPTGKSKCRVWIMEELQSWSRAGFAQQAMLLMLEDDSKSTLRSYVMACTTNPEKLKEAIKNRCAKIELRPLVDKDLRLLLSRIASKEDRDLPEAVMEQIIDVAGGSAREAVNQLNNALAAGDDEEAMLEVISGAKANDKVWTLFKALVYDKNPSWKKVVPILKGINEDPEAFRHKILKVAATEMLKPNSHVANRCQAIHEEFCDSYEYCAESGLVASCWRVIQTFAK